MTLGILEDYLREFKGCVIVISHDRFFLDSIADHLFVMEGNGVIKDFPGSYSEYRDMMREEEKARRQREAAAAPAVTDTSESKRNTTQRARRLSFKEKKELEALTAEIDTLTAEKDALEALFNSGETIDDVSAKAARYEEVKSLLDDKELRWLELSEFE